MGFKIGEVFKNDEESLIIDRKKQAMKMMIIFSAVIFVVLIALIVWRSMGDVDKERREKITVDMSALRSAMILWNQEAKSDSDFKYPGLDLNRSGDESAIKMTINGFEEEYRYGYYHIKPADYLDKLETKLNFSTEEYIVNYNTLDIINVEGIKYGRGRYHSMDDLLAISEIEKNPDANIPIPSANTHIIKSADEMMKLHQYPNANFKLAGNIDMSSYTSGKGWEPVKDFTGNFDGRGYTISNLTIKRPTESYVGLFGDIEDGIIKNVVFSDVDIVGENYTGTLAGTMSGQVSNVIIRSGNVGGSDKVGGLVGAHQGDISMCKVNLSIVSGQEEVGGVVGTFNFGSIRQVKSQISTINGDTAVGGFAGLVSASNEATLEECAITVGTVYNETDEKKIDYAPTGIFANQDIGGIIGRVEILNQYALNMKDCYAEGYISEGKTNQGGIIGKLRVGSSGAINMNSLYTTIEIPNKNETSGGCIGESDANTTARLSANYVFWQRKLAQGESLSDIGISQTSNRLNFTHKTEQEMKIRSTFTDWNFDVWEMDAYTSRPSLKFEKTFIEY